MVEFRSTSMTLERWKRIKEIFNAALDKPLEKRASFLGQVCSGDESLQHEVERLLGEHQEAGSTFLGSPFALDWSLRPGEVVASRYRIDYLLGKGGMGEVYASTDQLLQETVALKTLRADLGGNAAMLRRFRQEIQLARKVTHPNVCRVFEVGVHDFTSPGRPPVHFFTMQLLKGETLAARIRREGRIGGQAAFPLVVQMAEGLQAAHDVGIVHRDFKCGNVILTEGRAVITDFGIAGLTPQEDPTADRGSITAGTHVAGTIAYMSPEQMSGGAITSRSDIYSLGIVLFEMVTGQRPYESEQLIRAAMQRASGQIPSVRALAPDAASRWELAMNGCLQKDPARRFPKASDVAALFGPGVWRMPGLYMTRRRWAQGAAVSILAAAGTGGVWYWVRRPYTPKPEAFTWYRQGVEAFHATTYEAAKRRLQKATELDPAYAPAFAYLAACHDALDSSGQANEFILRAMAVAESHRLSREDSLRVRAFQYVISHTPERAQPLFEELAKLAPDRERPGALVDLAWLALKREDFAGARSAVNLALQLNRDYAAAQLQNAIFLARQRSQEAAEAAFNKAEALFSAATDPDGVAETLTQHALALARFNRAEEAIRMAERGIDISRSSENRFHEVRLQLVLALAYRNRGETARSKEVAENAVRVAVDNRMDATASIGLLDLGSAYLQRGEPELAEQYFTKGLDLAKAGRASFSQARALLSLGSLTTEYDRPQEALRYLKAALPFFREGNHRRELMQAQLLLGGVHNTLANFSEAQTTLQEAAALAVAIRDSEYAGLAHGYLGETGLGSGDWTWALDELDRALAILGDMRGGYRAAFVLIRRARLRARLGLFSQARIDWAEAEARVSKLEGSQAQLRARLVLAQAEFAYFQKGWTAALAFARSASALEGGTAEDVEATAWVGLALIQLGQIDPGVAECRKAQSAARQKSLEYLAGPMAQGRAEALFEHGRHEEARVLAQEALSFFRARNIWEGTWRALRILAFDSGGEQLEEARSALGRLRQTWSADAVTAYLKRPDLARYSL